MPIYRFKTWHNGYTLKLGVINANLTLLKLGKLGKQRNLVVRSANGALLKTWHYGYTEKLGGDKCQINDFKTWHNGYTEKLGGNKCQFIALKLGIMGIQRTWSDKCLLDAFENLA